MGKGVRVGATVPPAGEGEGSDVGETAWLAVAKAVGVGLDWATRVASTVAVGRGVGVPSGKNPNASAMA